MITKFQARIEEVKASPEAAELRAFDQRLGRILGYGKAAAAAIGSAFAAGIGWLVIQYADGWLAFAAGGITAALVLLMLGHARNALVRPPTISALVAEDIVSRAKPLALVFGLAARLRGQRAPKA